MILYNPQYIIYRSSNVNNKYVPDILIFRRCQDRFGNIEREDALHTPI